MPQATGRRGDQAGSASPHLGTAQGQVGTFRPHLCVLHCLLQLSNLGLHRVLAAQDVGEALCQLLLQRKR